MQRQASPPEFSHEINCDAGEGVGSLLRRLVTMFRAETDARLGPYGLTNAQWEPLLKLYRSQASTVAELARSGQMDPGATTRMLDRLQAKGLCKRVRSTGDRRVLNLELTPEGTEVAKAIPPVLAAVMNDHLAGFSKTEWQALVAYLQRMLANADHLREETQAR